MEPSHRKLSSYSSYCSDPTFTNLAISFQIKKPSANIEFLETYAHLATSSISKKSILSSFLLSLSYKLVICFHARPPVKALLGGSPLVFNRFLYETIEFIRIFVIDNAMAFLERFRRFHSRLYLALLQLQLNTFPF